VTVQPLGVHGHAVIKIVFWSEKVKIAADNIFSGDCQTTFGESALVMTKPGFSEDGAD